MFIYILEHRTQDDSTPMFYGSTLLSCIDFILDNPYKWEGDYYWAIGREELDNKNIVAGEWKNYDKLGNEIDAIT